MATTKQDGLAAAVVEAAEHDLAVLREYAAAPDTITILGARFARAKNVDHLSPAWYEGTVCGLSVSVWAPKKDETSHACALSVPPGGLYHGHGKSHEDAVRAAISVALDALDALRLSESALRRVSEPLRPASRWARGDSRSARLSPSNLGRFALALAAGNTPEDAATMARTRATADRVESAIEAALDRSGR